MISDIRLQHYRSYDDESFEFDPAVNIIVGPNASGKTNLLEALLVAARGSSYRAKDTDLIAYDREWARVDMRTVDSQRTVKIQQLPAGKSYEIDGKTYKRLSLAQTFPAVLFEPNHLLLLHGSPDVRRDYLDELLEQTIPGFSTLRREYRRALAQRNALLKRGGTVIQTQIFPWDIRLSELGGKIVQARAELIERINTAASELYSDLAKHKSEVRVHYETSLDIATYESQLLKHLEHNLQRDSERGFTGSGPHREDFSITLNGYAMQLVASRGEVRTAVLMLKVVEVRLIEQARGQKPFLLLDDVFSELDGARRAALTSHLQSYQTFMTTTDADVVVEHFLDSSRIIPLSQES